MFQVSDDPLDVAPLAQVSPNPKYVTTAPRAIATIDGHDYLLKRYSVQHNSHGSSDTATITMPISPNPDFSMLLQRGEIATIAVPGQTNGQPVMDDSPVYVEIWAGFPSNWSVSSPGIKQLTRRFLGILDVYSAALGHDEVTFNCRSLAAPLVDDKITSINWAGTSVDFLNYYAGTLNMRTSVKIANAPAKLSAVLAFNGYGGSNLQGEVYQMHPWDLLLKCAQVDDADLFVDNNGVLHYEAPYLIDRQSFDMAWLRDWHDDLTLTHSPQFSKNIVVKGRVTNPRTKTSTTTHIATGPDGSIVLSTSTHVVQTSVIPGTNQTVSTRVDPDGNVSVTNSTSTGGTYTSSQSETASRSGKEVYIVPIPTGTPPQLVNQILQNAWRQYSMHEYAIVGSFDVDERTLALDITSTIELSNTPYALFNDKYWPRQLDEEFDPDGTGWVVTAHCVDHTPPIGEV